MAVESQVRMTNPVGRLIQRLGKSLNADAASRLRDGKLLERFIADNDEAAFTVLVERHGPMVLGVCQRVLGNSHDAADAFQATFLVLARKTGTIRKSDSVASWLYGVAQRV